MQQRLPLKKTKTSGRSHYFFISTNSLWASVGKPNLLRRLDLPWGCAILLGLNTTTFETFAISITENTESRPLQVNFYQSQGSTGMTSDPVTPGNKQAKQPHPTYPLTRVPLFWFLGVWYCPYACTHCWCYNTWLASGVLLFAPGPALHLFLSSCHYLLWFGELKDKMSLLKKNTYENTANCSVFFQFNDYEPLKTSCSYWLSPGISWWTCHCQNKAPWKHMETQHFEIETSCWSGQPAHRMTALDVHHDLKQCLLGFGSKAFIDPRKGKDFVATTGTTVPPHDLLKVWR